MPWGLSRTADPHKGCEIVYLANNFKKAELMQASDELIEKLEEGVKTINTQHRGIFDLTTDLFAHCVGDDEKENQYFGTIIQRAVELVVAHFRTEEDLMLETKFDVYEYIEHRREHEEFVSTVTGYVSQFNTTGCIDLLTFASYAKWWVISHIKRHDRKYVNYFNKITEGKGLEKMNV
jgi:hemerythrin